MDLKHRYKTTASFFSERYFFIDIFLFIEAKLGLYGPFYISPLLVYGRNEVKNKCYELNEMIRCSLRATASHEGSSVSHVVRTKMFCLHF